MKHIKTVMAFYAERRIEKLISGVRGEGKFQMKLSSIDEIAIVEGKEVKPDQICF